jgi:hypothetical protein
MTVWTKALMAPFQICRVVLLVNFVLHSRVPAQAPAASRHAKLPILVGES